MELKLVTADRIDYCSTCGKEHGFECPEDKKEEVVEPYNPFSFFKYRKIPRLGKEETEGILDGMCHIQEKVDGANTSIWLDENGFMHGGSRSNDLTKNGNEFNGFMKYIHNHAGIKALLAEFPTYRLYGEWLVRHTIAYKETAYKKWYMFDICDEGKFLPITRVNQLAEDYGIDVVPYHGLFEKPTMEQLQEFIGKSSFGDRGEGIVIKNLEFINKFGDLEYAKVVTESFKEDNGIVFGGNNKHSDTYWEVYVVNKYMTLARIEKILSKIQPEVNKKLDMEHIPRIMGTAYHDMITEEAWEIANKVPSLDYKVLKRISDKKSKQIFIDILNDSISVADQK